MYTSMDNEVEILSKEHISKAIQKITKTRYFIE